VSKIKKFVAIIAKLFLSVFISATIAVILMTIGEFVTLDLHLSESSLGYSTLYYFLPFLIFLLSTIFLMKSKGAKIYILAVLVTLLLYSIGWLYARNKIKPFKTASKYAAEAEANVDWKKSNDPKIFLDGEAKQVELYEKASLQDFGYEIWIKKYYKDWYNLKKELYELDKQLISGQLVISQAESDKKLEEFNQRVADLQLGVVGPFWMGFYNVNY